MQRRCRQADTFQQRRGWTIYNKESTTLVSNRVYYFTLGYYSYRLTTLPAGRQGSQSFHRVRREVTCLVSNLCELCLISVCSARPYRMPARTERYVRAGYVPARMTRSGGWLNVLIDFLDSMDIRTEFSVTPIVIDKSG
jgi:hypothetical protein